MNIVAGKYKGRKLVSPPTSEAVRPTSNMAREAIFNVLAPYIYETDCLDLFAGTGAMGIEALSRGAKSAIFVDKSKVSAQIIEKNCAFLEEKPLIVVRDYYDALDFLKHKKFDIVFIDAPYDMLVLPQILTFMKKNAMLNEDGFVCYEHSTNAKVEIIDGCELFKVKKYGKASVSFVRYCK
ncbi:MAG: 16S rRNA (guanine(966)-N(2))-methyltransferase RsmD [Clostridia bacterium]